MATNKSQDSEPIAPAPTGRPPLVKVAEQAASAENKQVKELDKQAPIDLENPAKDGDK